MRLEKGIDATKYDIRILWTGIKEGHTSPDLGLVEGYPLDPPDDGPGWTLVDYGVQSLKDADRYWTLWIREKTAVKAKAKAKKKSTPNPPNPPSTKPKEGKTSTKAKTKTPPPDAEGETAGAEPPAN